MKLFSISTATAFILSMVVCVQTAWADTWTIAGDKGGIDATFVELAGDTVKLKKADGTVIAVPLKWLSAASQQMAADMAKKAANPATSAQQTVKVMQSAVAAGDVLVLWNLLPQEYQNDLNQRLHSFAKKMDPLVWQEIVGVLKTTTAMLKKQKQLIFTNALLSQGIKDPQGLSKTYDEIVAGLELLIASKATDLDQLKQINVSAFLAGPGKDISRKMSAMAKLSEQLHAPKDAKPLSPVASLLIGNVKITTVEQNAEEATLRFTTPGKDGAEDTVEDTKFVKYKGKWITRGFVNKWDEDMKKMEQAFDSMRNKFPSLRLELAAVLKYVKQLEAAKTAEEFDTAVKQSLIAFLRAIGKLPQNPQPAG